MTKKEKLKELYQKLQALDKVPVADVASLADSLIKEEVASVAARIKGDPAIKILEQFGKELKTFKESFNLAPILDSVAALSQEIDQSNKTLTADFESRLRAIKMPAPFDPASLERQIKNIKDSFESRFKGLDDGSAMKANVEGIRSLVSALRTEVQRTQASLPKPFDSSGLQTSLEAMIDDKVEALRTEAFQRISKLGQEHGGGAISRQIFVGSTNALAKYSDVTLKAGSNVTLTTANNNTTKRAEITITSSGGGGGGTVRSIANISTDTSADFASGTDYVYLCTGTLTLTMPDASTNTNLYTVKNVGTGTVTIATSLAQTIDNSATIVLPVRYTSVDLISDTANWNVT